MPLLDELDREMKRHTIVRTCETCGHTGTDVHQCPIYSKVLHRDTTEFQCDDITACWMRKYGEEKKYSVKSREFDTDGEAIRTIR